MGVLGKIKSFSQKHLANPAHLPKTHNFTRLLEMPCEVNADA